METTPSTLRDRAHVRRYHLPMTSTSPMDFLTGTTCQLTPGTAPWGPGWYLVGQNARVECGPYPTPEAAEAAASWLHDNSLGVHPSPWEPRWSGTGLLVGSRVRVREPGERPLALAG